MKTVEELFEAWGVPVEVRARVIAERHWTGAVEIDPGVLGPIVEDAAAHLGAGPVRPEPEPQPEPAPDEAEALRAELDAVRRENEDLKAEAAKAAKPKPARGRKPKPDPEPKPDA